MVALALAFTAKSSSAQSMPQDLVNLHNKARVTVGVGPCHGHRGRRRGGQQVRPELRGEARRRLHESRWCTPGGRTARTTPPGRC